MAAKVPEVAQSSHIYKGLKKEDQVLRGLLNEVNLIEQITNLNHMSSSQTKSLYDFRPIKKNHNQFALATMTGANEIKTNINRSEIDPLLNQRTPKLST